MGPSPTLAIASYALALLAAGPCVYLAALSVAALRGRSRTEHDGSADGHLLFVVPAHDEEADIEATVRALAELADEESSIHVVADNCTDLTAELARRCGEHSPRPVHVWERHDATYKAKGYALRWALPRLFAWSDAEGAPAAFVCIVDADARLTPGSVALARRAFAAGHAILQSEYVFDEGLGLRADIMRIASAVLVARGLGRGALGLSDTLKGNGMWFRREVLERMPWNAYSLAEDLEYTMRLLHAGYTIHPLRGSRVGGKLAATRKGETDQRLRWEGGRWKIVRAETWPLLRAWLRRPSLKLADALLELLIPPLALLVALQAAVGGVTFLLPGQAWLLILAGWVLLGFCIVAGVRLAALPARILLALGYVPLYIAWKLWLLPRTWIASRSKRWIRTTR